MNDRDRVRLGHILESIIELDSFLSGIDSSKTFQENKLVRSACVRQLEVIGEACGALSPEFVEENPIEDWQAWKAMRNILIHQYFGVDYHRVYSVILEEIPRLKSLVASLLE